VTLGQILRMVLVLTLFTATWGGILSIVKIATEDQIQYQHIKKIKAPALRQAISIPYDNDPIKDRRTIVIGRDKQGNPVEKTLFYAKKNGQVQAVIFESAASGYKDLVGVMLSINVHKGTLDGISITTHSETPGVGTRAFQNRPFMRQFAGQPLNTNFSSQAGELDAVSGATYTSNAIMNAVNKGVELYNHHKSKILADS